MLHSYFKVNDNTVINTLGLRSACEQGLCMTKTGSVPLCESCYLLLGLHLSDSSENSWCVRVFLY